VRQRVRFTKRGKVRFLSHRDLARVWERALRRAGIRVAYSEGFSPRPKVSFGLALSTGYESLGEYLDIDLVEDLEPDELVALVNPSLPAGMEAQVAIRIPAGTDSLQQAVTSSAWEIEVPGVEPHRLEEAVAAALATDTLTIVVERKGSKTDLDARPAILALEARGSVLVAELATHPRSLRPAELLRALDPSWTAGSVLRTHQWTSVDGARCEPIPLGDLGARGATSAPHAEARAS
jgi:radical SAM-linked protein